MRTKAKSEYTNKPKGIALEFKVSRPNSISGYQIGGNFEYVSEIANSTEVLEREFKALEVIAEENGCSMQDWSPLALKLAFKHEPRLQYYTQKKAGRKKQWNALLGAYFWFDVEQYLKNNTEHTAASACLYLSKQAQWKENNFLTENKPKSLEAAYVQHAKTSPLVKDYIRIIERIGWDEFVKCFKETFAIENRKKNLENWQAAELF